MNLVCVEKVKYFKGAGLLKQQNAKLPINVHRHVVQSIGTYPQPVAALADVVVGFLVDDSNRDVILYQCERSDEPGWPTTSLVPHRASELVLSIPPKARETDHEYRCKRRCHYTSATDFRCLKSTMLHMGCKLLHAIYSASAIHSLVLSHRHHARKTLCGLFYQWRHGDRQPVTCRIATVVHEP